MDSPPEKMELYQNAVPPRAPFCGLGAISELAAQLIEVNKIANKTLIENKGPIRWLLRFFQSSKLPIILERFAAHVRKLAQRTQGENLFFDDDGMPLDMRRVDLTYETVRTLTPLLVAEQLKLDIVPKAYDQPLVHLDTWCSSTP